MGRTLHLVVACTDSKRQVPDPSHQLRAYPRTSDRTKQWQSALREPGHPRMRAEDLYSGNHWAACRELPAEARSMGWSSVTLWVASAGYGLLDAGRLVVPYSATFASGHADSVPSGDSSASDERRAWWSALTTARRSVRALASEGAVLFVGSHAYLDAAQPDVRGALDAAARTARIVLVTSGRPPDGLEANAVLAAGVMRTELGGPMTSLNARLAQRIVGSLGPSDWSVRAARALATEVEAIAPPAPKPDREPVTDAALRTYVRRGLGRDGSASASRLLRALRESGRACEQKRFGRLFREERDSWLAAE